MVKRKFNYVNSHSGLYSDVISTENGVYVMLIENWLPLTESCFTSLSDIVAAHVPCCVYTDGVTLSVSS